MVSARIVIATVLAVIALALAVFGMLGENLIGIGGHASLAASHFGSLGHVPGLIALGLSASSFVLSWGQKSYIAAGFLIAAGILYSMHLAPFLEDHSVIAFPGPIVGLVIGHIILALGISTAIGSVRTRIVQSPNK